MRPELLKQTLKAIFNGDKSPVLITGAPGGGKTSVAKQTTVELDIHKSHINLATMLTEDFGVPDMGTDRPTFDYKLTSWYPAKGSHWDDGRGGMLIVDDRNQATPDIQKVMAHIQQERDLHGVPMADGWMVVSTGNRVQDRAGSNRVLSHLADRETEYEFDTHLDDWTRYAIDANIKPEVISFIRFRTALLHDFDPQRPKNATPRGWENVSKLLGVVPKEAEYETFKGRIGEGAAAEFTGFLKICRKLPNPDRVLMDPEGAEVPTDPATLFALAGSLADRATEANFGKLTTYSNRMPQDFSVLCVSHAVRRDKELADTQAFTKWILDHEEVLF